MKIEDTKKQKSKLPAMIQGILIAANAVLLVLLVRNMQELKNWKAQFEQPVTAQEEAAEEILIMLPETVYAASGLTMEIYNTQVTSLGEDITRYNVCWKCDVGENLERKFSVTADETNAGSYTLTLEIYNNALELVAQKACTLELVEGKAEKLKLAKEITAFEQVSEECLEQAKISVDTEYNGALEALKPEGLEQLRDVVYSVLSGI